MTNKSASTAGSEGSSSSQKVFGVRGLNPEIIKALRILALKREESVRKLLEEAITDLLKKYGES